MVVRGSGGVSYIDTMKTQFESKVYVVWGSSGVVVGLVIL